MFPDDQEPLARNLAMQASRRNSRRQGVPQGGMPNTIRPMDNLEAQAAMDSMQYEDPPSQSPFRLAIGDGNAAPIQTVQQRQSGARMDCSTGKCRLVQQPVQQAQPAQQRSALAQQLGLPPGSTVTAVDGVPVGQGMGFPAPPPPPSFQGMPSGGVVSNPPPVSSVTGNGRDYLDEVAETLGAFSPGIGVMAKGAGLMARGQVQDRMMLEAPAQERAGRRLTLEERLGDEEILTNQANRVAQREQGVAGLTATVNAMLKGIGEHADQDAIARADIATIAMMNAYNTGALATTDKFDFEGTRNRHRGVAIAHDLAKLVTRRAVFKNMGTPGNKDQMQFATGAAKYMDEMFVGAYRGRKNADGSYLRGDALRDAMSDELMEPLAQTLRGDFMKAYPGADAEQALLHAENLAFDMVENYQKQIDYANAAMESGSISRSDFNTALDDMATKASQNLPRLDYSVPPPQPTTTAPR
jgi:hypothetical protein